MIDLSHLVGVQPNASKGYRQKVSCRMTQTILQILYIPSHATQVIVGPFNRVSLEFDVSLNLYFFVCMSLAILQEIGNEVLELMY